MIYLYTKLDTIKNYWRKEFDKKYGTTIVDDLFFEFNKEFKSDDILILDIDQFSSVEETIKHFEKIPKNLNTIALLDLPKLAHGAFFIKKGFKSYIGKKTSKIIIDQALMAVRDGNVWLYPQLMNYIIKHISISNQNQNSEQQHLDALTTKEQDVANYIAQGYSNKEIAKTLNIQLVTVKKHVGSIFTKLDVKDRVALAILINSQ